VGPAVPIAFSRSLRAIEADRLRRSPLALVAGTLLAGVWAGWFFLSRVDVLEIAETARLEVERSPYPLEAPVSGRIVATHLVLGQEVKKGDLLVELDTEAIRLSLEEEQARQAAIPAQVSALRDEITAKERALADRRQATRAKVDEARARSRETGARVAFSEKEAKRSAELRAGGLLSEADALRSEAEAEQRRAELGVAELSIGRIGAEERTAESDLRASVARLHGEIAALEGQVATGTATLKQLQHDIELRRIRATADGYLGEAPALQVGAVLREKDRIGVVVPKGSLRAVAEFLPSRAIGRIRPGSTAKLRMDGFPWTQYGTLAATVAGVASEPTDGRIRVELLVHPDPSSAIPLSHGLPGTLEVLVERVSPATLALRTAGHLGAPAEGRSDLTVESRP
jgi:membrane fusion protein (multidrug efflux system)